MNNQKPLKQPSWWDGFAAEYLKNRENAVQAYLKAKPKVTRRTAEVESSKLLRKPEFLEVLEQHRKEARAAVAMDRDEWFRILAEKARVSAFDFIDPKAKTLRKDALARPDHHAIKKIKLSDKGMEIETCDSMDALIIIGKALGVLTTSS